MREVSFGQYYPANSFVHKCDPRLKLLFLIAYIVAIFIAKNFYALGACALVFLLVACASGVPFGSLIRSVKAVLFLLLFTAVLNLFFHSGEKVLVEWGFIRITQEAVYFTVFFCRAVVFARARLGGAYAHHHARCAYRRYRKLTFAPQMD